MRKPKPPKTKYSLPDFWEWYVLERKKPVDKKVYIKVCKELLWEISRALILELFEYAAPARMGKFAITPTKSGNKKIINWKETRKRKKHVRQMFPLTKKHVYRHRWFKYNAYTSFKNRGVYNFKTIQDNVNRMIGTRGLYGHMFKLRQDPTKQPFERV